MERVRIVGNDGKSYYVAVPPGVDPVHVAHGLTGGTVVGKSSWDPGPWVETEGGGQILVATIAGVFLEDYEADFPEADEASKAKPSGNSKTVAAIAATGFLSALAGVPVQTAQGMIDNAMKSGGQQPTLILASDPEVNPPVKGDRDFIVHLREGLKAGGERRVEAIRALKHLAPLFGLSPQKAAANPDATVEAIAAALKPRSSAKVTFQLVFRTAD